jgi:uncharacterized protein
MKKISKNLLNSITDRLVKEFNPVKIILFGSHAWGNPTEDSDIDICIIIPYSDESPANRIRRAHKCLNDFSISKDILVKTILEIEKYRNVIASFERKILEDGKVLYEK